MKTITRNEAVELIKETNGKVFTVNFYKKNGDLRTMNARLGVKKHLKGGVLKFDPSERGLMPVFDMQIKKYRMINLRSIVGLTVNSKNFVVA